MTLTSLQNREKPKQNESREPRSRPWALWGGDGKGSGKGREGMDETAQENLLGCGDCMCRVRV